MLYDDDPELLRLLNTYLTEFGYLVQVLENGEMVHECLNTFNPDILLIDAMLAGMDGREICKSIKIEKIHYSQPVILISVIPEMGPALNQAGAPDEFLAKPFILIIYWNELNIS